MTMIRVTAEPGRICIRRNRKSSAENCWSKEPKERANKKKWKPSTKQGRKATQTEQDRYGLQSGPGSSKKPKIEGGRRDADGKESQN